MSTSKRSKRTTDDDQSPVTGTGTTRSQVKATYGTSTAPGAHGQAAHGGKRPTKNSPPPSKAAEEEDRSEDEDQNEDSENSVGDDEEIEEVDDSAAETGSGKVSGSGRPSTVQEGGGGISMFKVFVSGAVLLFAFLAFDSHYNFVDETQKPAPVLQTVQEKFIAGLAKMREEFPSQSERFWSKLEAGLLPILGNGSKRPVAILLVASPGSEAVANCLAQTFASVVTKIVKSQKPVVFDASKETVAGKSPDEVKKSLDDRLTNAFSSGIKSGLVLHIEALYGESAMILYRFCDTDNAPFKDVALLLTLNLAEKVDTEKDHVVDDELKRIWGDVLNPDRLDQMLDRIRNSVAFVRPETNEVLWAADC